MSDFNARANLRERATLFVLILIVFSILSGYGLRFFRRPLLPMGGIWYRVEDMRQFYTPSILPRAYETATATWIFAGVLVMLIAWGFYLKRKRARWTAEWTGS